MNRKEAIVVTVLLSATFISAVFADSTPTSPTKTISLQTSSIDVGLFNPQQFNPQLGFEFWNIPSQSSVPEVNFTAAFAFAPATGFVRVTSLALTIIYTFSTTTGQRPSNMAFNVEINVQSSGSLTLPVFQATATAAGFLGTQALHPGSNTINIALPPNDVLTLFQAHLTIEYTFLA